MNKQEIIHEAVRIHFACEPHHLKCSDKLEENVNCALDFLTYFQTGLKNKGYLSLVNSKNFEVRKRYRNKEQLIKRYIKLNK